MSKLHFKPLKKKKMLVLNHEDSMGAFIGVLIGIKNLPTLSEYSVGVNLKRNSFKNILKALSLDIPNVADKNENIIHVNVFSDSFTGSNYMRKDIVDDKQWQSREYPHIDPERFNINPFPYSKIVTTMRDIYDMVKMTNLTHPMEILENVRSLKPSTSTYVDSCIDQYLNKKGLVNKPFLCVDTNFTKCPNVEESFPDAIRLPSEEEFELLPAEDQVALFYLMGNKNCTGVGISSTFWMSVAIVWVHTHQFFIWDLDSNLDKEFEALAYHVDHELISLISLDRSVSGAMIDLAKSLMDYHKVNKESLESTGERVELYRPLIYMTESVDWVK